MFDNKTFSSNFFIARQPVFNRRLETVGYELLYRSSSVNQAEFSDGEQATIQVLLNTFANIGVERVVGTGKAFINLTQSFILNRYPIPVSPSQVIFEILENCNPTEQMMEALRHLRRLGYQFALDDIIEYEQVIPYWGLFKIAKVDLRKISPNRLSTLVSILKPHHIWLAAEKVETLDELKLCMRLGFDLFQGYFLCQPRVFQEKRVDTSRMVILKTLLKMREADVNFKDIENLIAQDVVLSYKLLKLVNSAYYSFATKIKSLRQAISLIGIHRLQGWMVLLLMASMENKPHELTNIALLRAILAEKIAQSLGEKQTDPFFLSGLFSVLDALFDMPMEKVVTSVPLSTEIAEALIHHSGKAGLVLSAILASERENWDELLQIGLQPHVINNIFFEAFIWTTTLSKEIHER